MSQQEIRKSKFKFRVVGIAIHEHRVLLHKAEKNDFWSLPGGKIELFEPSVTALKRELREELRVGIEVERLIWVVEYFYPKKKKFIHEFAFYYLIKFHDNPEIYLKTDAFMGSEGDMKLYFKWYDLSDIHQLKIYPDFLKQRLNNIRTGIEHIIANP